MTTSRWEQLYREDKRIPDTSHSQAAERAAERFLDHGKRLILDLGCGAGRDAGYLAGRGLQVVGLDLAAAGLALAAQHGRALPLVQGDGRRVPFPERTFEGVYCFGLLHEFVGVGWEADVAAVMGEVRRVLRPDGLAVLTVLAGDPAAGLPHVHLFSEAEFLSTVRGFVLHEQDCYADRGCTGREDYRVWYAVLRRQEMI